MASRPELLTPELEVDHRVLARFLLERCGLKPGADTPGFSLHAAVRGEADGRQGLERLCGCIPWPARERERAPCDTAGRVAPTLETPWYDDPTHPVTSPLKFMQRLAAPAPRPRLHRVRLHGALAPTVELHAQGVPAEPPDEAGARLDCEGVEPRPDDGH